MKLTLEEEITVLQETRGLPTGQRCMRLGYPEIKLTDLEARFAVHQLAEAQNMQEEDRVFRELAARALIEPEEARRRFKLGSDGSVIDDARQRMLMNMIQNSSAFDRVDSLAWLMRSNEESLWNQLSNRNNPVPDVRSIRETARARDISRREALRGDSMLSVDGIKFKRVTGFVKIMDLDDYMEEVIPERVLESIEVAKEAGLKTFKVAFPCLKTDEMETKQFDPVVFAELGKRWLEIDMWE